MKSWKYTYTPAAVFAAVMLCLSMEAAVAAPQSALAERYSAVEAAVNAKDPRAWAEAMYADNVVVIGEGSEKAVRGLDSLMPVLQEIVAGSQSCSIAMNDTKLNGVQAWSFATWRCTPAQGEPYQVRALYVWEQMKVGWRVVAEMYGMGEMK